MSKGDLGVTTKQGGPLTAASPLAVPLHRDGHNTRSRTEQTSVSGHSLLATSLQ